MEVTVIDREAMRQTWGHGLYSPILKTVEIVPTCPKCGGPRGEPRLQRQCEDGEWFNVSRWDNPCGHIDKYTDVLVEAADKPPAKPYPFCSLPGCAEAGRCLRDPVCND